MKSILKNYEKKHGYTPSIFELFKLYTNGGINLTDNQENELLTEFKKNNLL